MKRLFLLGIVAMVAMVSCGEQHTKAIVYKVKQVNSNAIFSVESIEDARFTKPYYSIGDSIPVNRAQKNLINGRTKAVVLDVSM